MSVLPHQPAHRLAPRSDDSRWLVEGLWGEQAVGLIGGEPKSFKSFLALDLAVSVASGSPCLQRFQVPRPGRVLLFAAEDALHDVRWRLDGICSTRSIELERQDIQVITRPWLRLDQAEDAIALIDTIHELRPRLLVLDPFVRLHRIDENSSSDVARVLSLLRDLQKEYRFAICVVHHAKKGGAGLRAGQALRGSSEFHAWADAILYLRRRADRLVLSAEHRSAAGIEGLDLALTEQDGALALRIVEPTETQPGPSAEPPHERVRRALVEAGGPVALSAIREACRLRKATVCQVLADLVDQGLVHKHGHLYRDAATAIGSGSPSL